MLQRIQTVYFLLALICVSLSMFNLDLFSVTTFFPSETGETTTEVMSVSAFSVLIDGEARTEPSTLWIYCSVAVIAVLTTLVSFKDRDKQLLLSKLSLTIVILTSGWFLFTAIKNANMSSNHEQSLSLGIALYVYIAAIPFLVLGLLGVRKDKKLIDSIDRIR